ncbi:hypothetical protein Mgra_00000769 [Meloidogyne graminicola]|uniref:Twinfilin n=1 Tax=Meloidogyne graminicola TaxID=189291 RepID=A0A8T0A3F0_9BILA|nr:hypothetical protein Mgra_00000769 [Meloidogyne graminicola]
MTCQTGIRADAKLLEFFEQCKQCKIRFGKIVINNSSMKVNFHLNPSKDWRKDWRKCLPESIDSYEPCFLLFRFDSSHSWILISFADDKASVRDKMLLAATKATFKSEFGQSFIQAEYQVSNRNELQLEHFEKNYLNKDVENSAIEDGDESKPLSLVERELSSVTKERANNPFSFHASQTMRGVQFPIDQDAEEKLRLFASRQCDFVQLSVDCLNEAIKLEAHKNVMEDIGELDNLVPRKKPRYTLFRLQNETLTNGEAIFFIYSIPPSQSCTIKELMLFSSCKGPLLGEIEGNSIGIKIDKKIEVDSRDKLDLATLIAYMTPETNNNNCKTNSIIKQFERPPRPGSGPRRITKAVE